MGAPRRFRPAAPTSNCQQEETYRSKAERAFAVDLRRRGIPFDYESGSIPYVLECSYTHDFAIRTKSGKDVIVEFKGWMDGGELRTLSQVKKQNPDLDLRMVLQSRRDLDKPVRKNAKLTIKGWCAKHGIPVAAEILPEEWILE